MVWAVSCSQSQTLFLYLARGELTCHLQWGLWCARDGSGMGGITCVCQACVSVKTCPYTGDSMLAFQPSAKIILGWIGVGLGARASECWHRACGSVETEVTGRMHSLPNGCKGALAKRSELAGRWPRPGLWSPCLIPESGQPSVL